MIKLFCDACGDEMTEETDTMLLAWTIETANPITNKKVKVSVQLVRSVDGVWNGGQCCIACVKYAVSHGEESRR